MRKKKMATDLTSGSLNVCLITEIPLKTKLWKLKTPKCIFSFHNSSFKNQRIEWWKQWSKTHPNKCSSVGPTWFEWWKQKTEWYHSKLTTSKQTLIPFYSLKILNFHFSQNWEELEGIELDLMKFFTKTSKIPLYI